MSTFEVDADMWSRNAWRCLAIAMFEELERLNAITEFNVSLDPSVRWPDMILDLYPHSAKLSRE